MPTQTRVFRQKKTLISLWIKCVTIGVAIQIEFISWILFEIAFRIH